MKKWKNIFLKLAFILGTFSFLPLASNSCHDVKNTKINETFYKIGDRVFFNKNDAINFLYKNATIEEINKFKDVYLLGNNSYNNYYSVSSNIGKNINKQSVTTFLPDNQIIDLLNFDGEIPETFLSNFQFDKNDKNIIVYKGKDGFAHDSKEMAKNSYFNINSIYELQNKYHLTAEEMVKDYSKEAAEINKISYLNDAEKIKKLNEKFNITNEVGHFLHFPNGNIEKNNKSPSLTEKENLIERNLNVFYEIDGIFYRKEDLLKNPDLIFKNEKIYDVLKISSNKGKKRFIVDVNKNSGFTLLGNYIHKSSNNSIQDINQKDKWTKKNNLNLNGEYKLNEKQEIINSIASLLLKASNYEDIEKYIEEKEKGVFSNNYYIELENLYGFQHKSIEEIRTFFEKSESIFEIFDLLSDFKHFKNEMNKVIIDKTTNETLMDKFYEIIETTNKGKRGYLINQLPLIYMCGISYLGKTLASNETVKTFLEYIKNVNGYFNNIFKSLVGEDLYILDDGTKIDLNKIFEFDGVSIDSNFDINAYSSTLSENKNVFNALKNIWNSYTNMTLNFGIKEFDENDYDKTVLNFENNKSKLKTYYERFKIKNVSGKDTESLFYRKDNLIVLDEKMFKSTDNEVFKKFVKFVGFSSNQYIKHFNKYKSELFKKVIEKINVFGYYKENTYYDSYKKTQTQHIIDWMNFVANKTNDINIIKKAKELSNKFYEEINSGNDQRPVNTIAAFEWISKNDIFNAWADLEYTKYNLSKNLINLKNDYLLFSGLIKNLFTVVKETKIDETPYLAFKIANNFMNEMSQFFQQPATFAFKVFNIVFEIFTECIGKMKESSYVYVDNEEPNDFYVWDEGKYIEKWWGMENKDILTIENVEFLKPIQIDLPNINDYYLYNGKEYKSIETIKNEILNKMLTDDAVLHNYAKFYYTLNSFQDFLKEDEKITNKQKAINQWLKNNNYKKFSSSNYSINGIVVGSNNFEKYYEEVGKELLNKKPIYFAQIPKLYNLTNPLDQFKNISNNELFENLQEIINDLNNNKNIKDKKNIIFYDGNIKKNNEFLSENDIINILKSNLMQKIEVKNKQVSNINFSYEKKYENLNMSKEINIYWIEDNQKKKKYYFNYLDAFNELKKENYLNYRKAKIIEYTTTKITMNGQTFENLDKLYEYLNELVKQYEIKK